MHALEMPTPLSSPDITSLESLAGFIEPKLAADPNNVLWFRGCSKFNGHILQPGLYRHPTVTTIDEFVDFETKMLKRFSQRSIPFVERALADDWERLFFMQHFRVPTRLLDWSENPYVALYFALAEKNPGEDAALWIMDPIVWNRKSLAHLDYDEGILTVGDHRLDGYDPSTTDVDAMSNDPVAIYGFYNSARIVAQRGVFTIAGKDLSPMEEIYSSKNYPQDCLVKARIPAAEKEAILGRLFRIGFTHSVVFPELEGLAREMKNFFRFES